MMDGGKDWLEAILKRKAYDESAIKVLELNDGDPAPRKGENYLSKIKKLKAKVLLGSGKTKTISLLVKTEHETKHMKKMSTNAGWFNREIMMYRDIMPKMEELLEGINDPEGIFWAKIYEFRLYNRLVFEDLGDKGFKTGNRLKQLGLNAALMALRNLAKFHAVSRILMDRGEIPMDIFGKHLTLTSEERVKSTKSTIARNVKRMIAKLESWGDEWKDVLERLKVADLENRFVDAASPLEDEFQVLCHSDAWTGNMMFQGDIENPTGFRILDLQICCVNSPAKDVSHFLQTSVRLEVRTQHADLLLETYLDTLQSYLVKLGYEGKIPTMDDFKAALLRQAVVCLCDAMFSLAIVLIPAEHPVDFEENMRKANEAKERGEGATFEGPNFLEHLSPVGESVIKYELREAVKLGVI